MLRSVDLGQLAEAVAAVSWLMNALLALASIDPQASVDHPSAKRLPAHRNAMQRQLLSGEGGPEIGVPFPDQRQRGVPNRLWLRAVARTATFLGDQPRRALGSERLEQPEHLPTLQPEQLRRRRRRQPTAF